MIILPGRKGNAAYLWDRKSPRSVSLHLERSMGLIETAGDRGESGTCGVVISIISGSSPGFWTKVPIIVGRRSDTSL